ncbi:MAG: ATP-binding protein [Bacteroidota bacterium]
MQTTEIRPKKLWSAFRFLPISLILLLTAVFLDPIAHHNSKAKINTAVVERDFHRKLALLDKTAKEALDWVSREGWPEAIETNPGFSKHFADDNDGLALYLLNKDSVLFWTDNSLVISDRDLQMMESEKVHRLPNCNIYVRHYSAAPYSVIGFVFLKKFFPYNNEFVSNAFLVGKNIPASYKVSVPPVPGAIRINDDKGAYAFSVVASNETIPRKGLHWITLLLYCLSGILLLLCYSDLLTLGNQLKPSPFWLLALLADLIILRWILWQFNIPHCVYELPFFQPFDKPVFFFESRGDIYLSSILLIFFAYWFMHLFQLFPKSMSTDRRRTDSRLVQSLGVAGWLIVTATFLLVQRLIGYLLTQRPGLLEISRILSLTAANITDVLVIVGLLAGWVMILHRVIDRMKHRITLPQTLVSLLIVSALFFGLSRQTDSGIGWTGMLFFYLTTLLILYINYRTKLRLTHGIAALLLAMASVYLVVYIDDVNRRKENDRQAEILGHLSNEHDQIAEMLLTQIDAGIRSDTVLAGMITDRTADPMENQAAVTSYLKTNYFGLYWNRYEIQARSCDSVSRMLVQPDNFEVACLPYFLRDMRDRYGTKLTGSAGFYYLDNFDGLIDYLGVYRFFTPDSLYGANLIINIDSRLVSQELGYPELLITGKIDRDSLNGNYTYAKYNQGKLQSVTGTYDYSLTSDVYPGRTGEIVPFSRDHYQHWILRNVDDNEIVISRPSYRLVDYVITFSYVFVFLFAIWIVFYFIIRFRRMPTLRTVGLKQRIQATLISILVFSFVLIGGGMTWYVIQQYQRSNRKLIVEKTESLLTDIQHKLEKEPVLTPAWHDNTYRSLDELLLKFSYVFNTDMNIFDPSGNLIVSTRPEVFEYNLVGRRMNILAYEAVHHQRRTSYIARESIESLGYFSSYVPLFNKDNQLLGYINLPYFSRQSEIRKEVSTIVVAMLNGYFILIMLSIFLAVLLANQITKPLQQLQLKLAGLRFGKKNQEIEYRRGDEIGDLVREYNRLVNELQASAEKLARSERETAWREMARQIAHEIKNPLTPMKLSVQHLRRAWKDHAPDLDNHIDRVTNTLIDQIETLSAIASEFSKFAQMPGAHFEPIDLISKLKRLTFLFEDTCKITLHQVNPVSGEVIIYADPEQVLQVYNNLVRNAIQAVHESCEPVVDLFVEVKGDQVVVRVKDNGVGIPEELQDRLFEPNFTTKTSGMGLGLSIAKKIVEGSEGKIWFETRKDEGTAFFIEWPLYKPGR